MGIKEHIIFPEIDYDKVDKIRGMDICISTSAADDKSGVVKPRRFRARRRRELERGGAERVDTERARADARRRRRRESDEEGEESARETHVARCA